MALRLAAGGPRDHRRLALRLQRQQTPLRPRRTHSSRIRPTVDHDPPTPSRIATGPPNGPPSSTPAGAGIRPKGIFHRTGPAPAAPARLAAASTVTAMAHSMARRFMYCIG